MAGTKKPDGTRAKFEGRIGDSYRESTPWWPEDAKPPPGAPNVVFIVLDDAGFADLGCYGSEIDTPNIDRLAQNGLRFTNFHTTAMCSPTRACLLTGRQSHAVGVGIIAEWTSGFPGYQGRISRHAVSCQDRREPLTCEQLRRDRPQRVCGSALTPAAGPAWSARYPPSGRSGRCRTPGAPPECTTARAIAVGIPS